MSELSKEDGQWVSTEELFVCGKMHIYMITESVLSIKH